MLWNTRLFYCFYSSPFNTIIIKSALSSYIAHYRTIFNIQVAGKYRHIYLQLLQVNVFDVSFVHTISKIFNTKPKSLCIANKKKLSIATFSGTKRVGPRVAGSVKIESCMTRVAMRTRNAMLLKRRDTSWPIF